MQGRPSKEREPLRRPPGGTASLSGQGQLSAASRLKDLQETGQMPAIPKRPSNMPRVQSPHSAQKRISRPVRAEQSPQKRFRRLLILGAGFLICAILAAFLTSMVYQFTNSLNVVGGTGSTVATFFDAISHKDYEAAYKTLGPSITLHLSPEEFEQRSATVDACVGKVTDYKEVSSIPTNGDATTNQSFSYSLTREHLEKSYNLNIALQFDKFSNSWKIADYGLSLGPNPLPSPCPSK